MVANDSSVDLLENEDRISDLPDPLIHHILSFLPSTEESVRTGILSKMWKNQWAHVPILIFDIKSSGMSTDVDFARFIDNVLGLYECFKIKKFHIAYDFKEDTNFNSKLSFATSRDVEVLYLNFSQPNFIFENASLVELKIDNSDFELNYRINLPSLKALKISSCRSWVWLSIENVLSGCPSLESLELHSFRSESESVIIASKLLKILILEHGAIEVAQDGIEISCPNLEKLSLSNVDMVDDKTIVNVLSGSPLLHSLKLVYISLGQLVIDSKCLTELDIGCPGDSAVLEISCPNLEELSLNSFDIEKCKLMNLPSSCCATLDFYILFPLEEGCAKTLARKILKDLQAVKEVAVGNWFLELLSAIEMRQPSYPLLNIKCLTLYFLNFEHIVGIVNALRCSPALERLVIEFSAFQPQRTADLDLNNSLEAYLDSNVTGFTCFVSHLKIVHIIGLSKEDGKCKVVLHFLEFLLENAKALEKMIVILKDCGTDFLEEVSRKLLSFPRVSQHAIIEVLRSPDVSIFL